MEHIDPLTKDHPSFGCDRAIFIFSMIPVKGKSKSLVVEAKNSWAVALLERLSGQDQKVSPFCSLSMVVRNHRNVGVRSPDAIEVSLVDFVLDIVDRDKLLDDIGSMMSFAKCLSPEERSIVDAKLEAERAGVDDSIPKRVRKPDAKPAQVTAPPVAISALCSLGFKKKDVELWASSFDGSNLSISDFVKEGCKALGSAS